MTAEEVLHIAKLRILETLVDAFPFEEMHDFRYQVAWHQTHCLHLTSWMRNTSTNTKHMYAFFSIDHFFPHLLGIAAH